MNLVRREKRKRNPAADSLAGLSLHSKISRKREEGKEKKVL